MCHMLALSLSGQEPGGGGVQTQQLGPEGRGLWGTLMVCLSNLVIWSVNVTRSVFPDGGLKFSSPTAAAVKRTVRSSEGFPDYTANTANSGKQLDMCRNVQIKFRLRSRV